MKSLANESLHNPRVVDFKIGITPNVELEFITLSLIPPTGKFVMTINDHGSTNHIDLVICGLDFGIIISHVI